MYADLFAQTCVGAVLRITHDGLPNPQSATLATSSRLICTVPSPAAQGPASFSGRSRHCRGPRPPVQAALPSIHGLIQSVWYHKNALSREKNWDQPAPHPVFKVPQALAPPSVPILPLPFAFPFHSCSSKYLLAPLHPLTTPETTFFVAISQPSQIPTHLAPCLQMLIPCAMMVDL